MEHVQWRTSNSEQNYPWGRVGESSLSARLCSKTPNTGFKIEDQPYAEMWVRELQRRAFLLGIAVSETYSGRKGPFFSLCLSCNLV